MEVTTANHKMGWVKLFRSVKNHWIFPKNRSFTDFEAWVYILLEVNYVEEKVQMGYDVLICKRGEKLYSLNTWAACFNWNKSKVRRFFKFLEKENMIKLFDEKKTTRLIVCNYDDYQGLQNSSETEMKRLQHINGTDVTQLRNNSNTIQTPIKESNKDKEYNKDKEGKKEKNSIKLHSENFKNFQQVVSCFDSKFFTEDSWLKCYDQLIRIDGYSEERILEIVKELRSEGNWWKDSGNFETLLKLRKKDKEGIKYIDKFNKQTKKENYSYEFEENDFR